MKSNDPRSQAHGRYAPFQGHAAHGRLAHLKNLGKLFGSQKLFAIGHGVSGTDFQSVSEFGDCDTD